MLDWIRCFFGSHDLGAVIAADTPFGLRWIRKCSRPGCESVADVTCNPPAEEPAAEPERGEWSKRYNGGWFCVDCRGALHFTTDPCDECGTLPPLGGAPRSLPDRGEGRRDCPGPAACGECPGCLADKARAAKIKEERRE